MTFFDILTAVTPDGFTVWFWPGVVTLAVLFIADVTGAW